jgi:hypothetical protein
MTLIAPSSRPTGALSDMVLPQEPLGARAGTWLE